MVRLTDTQWRGCGQGTSFPVTRMRSASVLSNQALGRGDDRGTQRRRSEFDIDARLIKREWSWLCTAKIQTLFESGSLGERATTSNQVGFDVYADNPGCGVETGEVYRGATRAAAEIDDLLPAK